MRHARIVLPPFEDRPPGRLVAVVGVAEPCEVLLVRPASSGEGDAVVDLEVPRHIAARHHAGAVTVDSSNTVSNAGTISNAGEIGATGILVTNTGNITSTITNSGTITLAGPATTSTNFPAFVNNVGIAVTGSGTLQGSIITTSGSKTSSLLEMEYRLLETARRTPPRAVRT